MTIENLKKKNIGFVSLGCDKNRVDLEKMISALRNFGFNIVSDPMNANIIIVNTCSFLEASRLESIENIVEMGCYKKSGKLEKLIVTGCLNELKYEDLKSSLPEVDAFVNIKDNENIVKNIAKLYNIKLNQNYYCDRILTTPSHYAYLKISDGCNNFCSYCLIPYIRGRFKSVPMEELLDEAKKLSDSGVKELILVAQDVTRYGLDLYKKKMLVPLIQKLSQLDFTWIRLLYCYPEEIDDELISEIKNNDKVVKYLDIPLQHVSTNILKAMNRKSDFDSICRLIEKLKNEINGIAIRTTFIVGFPGETENDVLCISEFLKKYKLNNVGFFKYSREEGTRAYSFENQIEESEKEKRENTLALVQYDIVCENNKNLIGKTFDVIIDEVSGTTSFGRHYGFAPDIDGIIKINEKLDVGKFYKIKIVGQIDYDLIGERI